MKVECNNCNGSGNVSLGEGVRGIKKCDVCGGIGEVEWKKEILADLVNIERTKEDYLEIIDILEFEEENINKIKAINALSYLIEECFKLKEENKELKRQYDYVTREDGNGFLAQVRWERDMWQGIVDSYKIQEEEAYNKGKSDAFTDKQ